MSKSDGEGGWVGMECEAVLAGLAAYLCRWPHFELAFKVGTHFLGVATVYHNSRRWMCDPSILFVLLPKAISTQRDQAQTIYNKIN